MLFLEQMVNAGLECSVSFDPELEYLQFPEHYAYALVESGETKVIFDMQVSGGYVAFIERIACDWEPGSKPPSTAAVLELIIDGVTRRFDYEVQINKPYVYDPPLVARHSIKWRVTNNDVPHVEDGVQKTGGAYFGVLTDGLLCRPKV